MSDDRSPRSLRVSGTLAFSSLLLRNIRAPHASITVPWRARGVCRCPLCAGERGTTGPLFTASESMQSLEVSALPSCGAARSIPADRKSKAIPVPRRSSGLVIKHLCTRHQNTCIFCHLPRGADKHSVNEGLQLIMVDGARKRLLANPHDVLRSLAGLKSGSSVGFLPVI